MALLLNRQHFHTNDASNTLLGSIIIRLLKDRDTCTVPFHCTMVSIFIQLHVKPFAHIFLSPNLF